MDFWDAGGKLVEPDEGSDGSENKPIPWEQWFQIIRRATNWTYETIGQMTVVQMMSVMKTPMEGKIGVVDATQGAAIRAQRQTNREYWIDRELERWQQINLN